MTLDPRAVWVGSNPAFEEHLKKTGVLYRAVRADEDWPENAALVLWAGEPSEAPKDKLSKFLATGRFLLVPEKCRRLFGPAPAKNIRTFPDDWLVDVPPGKAGRVKTFAFGSARPKEEVAAFPRARVRLELAETIRGIYAEQGLICPRLSLYPGGFRSLFSFRVDADEYEPELFERFFETAKKYSRAISIFFSMANYERHSDQIKRCVDHGFDVHSHAYTHFTYRSHAQNLFNLRKADEALSKAGAPKKGFAAPYGRWNPELQRAIEERGYDFSSEFSYNYDDFPSYPVIGGRRSTVLQVPVHPVGLGIYMESARAYDEKEIRDYYSRLFRLKYECGEPVIFYDHPTRWLGVHPGFMDFLFGLAAAHRDVWVCSISEWAAWWKKREAAGAALLEPRPEPSSHAHWNEGRIWRETNPVRGLKSAVKDWLDWETATPAEEIVRESLPSRLKFALRRLRR